MAKLMQYRGYYGSAEASPEDGCLYGKLEFISSLVSYEATTVPKLVKAFHQAVDDYLLTCEQLLSVRNNGRCEIDSTRLRPILTLRAA